MKFRSSFSSAGATRTAVAVAAVVTALAGGAASAWSAMPPDAMGHPGGPMMMMGMGMGMGMGGPGLLAGANLSADQRSRIDAIMKSARDDLRKQRDEGRTLHEQMAALLAAATIDPAQVESVRTQLSLHHDATSKRMTQAMIDVANVLTPEQRKAVAEKAQQRRAMMERHRREREALDPPPQR